MYVHIYVYIYIYIYICMLSCVSFVLTKGSGAASKVMRHFICFKKKHMITTMTTITITIMIGLLAITIL